MNITFEKHHSVDIVRCAGALVSSNAPSMGKQLQKLIRAGQNKIIVDLSGVDFMDASGLSVLVRNCERVRRFGGDLLLLKLCPSIETLFSMTRLNGMFRIFDDESAAVNTLR
ncbi:MAG: STAS domain-containing protein [Gammaproteobacteria bacterium]|nr:STAS domain-containing protein [Gammaproteobacteria bacterium]